jgi:ribokinase
MSQKAAGPGRVVVVGSLNLDVVVRAARIPQAGETILGGELTYVPGGKGANQAVAVARLGARVAMVGKVGGDAFAATLLDSLDAAGVDRQFVTQSESASSGVALIVVDTQGENSIVVASGANAELTPADVDAAEAAFAGADVLLLQLETPLETVTRAAELGRRHGLTVILNPAPAVPLPPALTALVDILVPNESEASLLSGLAPNDSAAAAEQLLAWGVGDVIVTLGRRGALWVSRRGSHRFGAHPVTALDTSAAGDAFVGALAVALAEGRTRQEAIRWGNAGGALAATGFGAQPSLPSRPALLALLGQAG